MQTFFLHNAPPGVVTGRPEVAPSLVHLESRAANVPPDPVPVPQPEPLPAMPDTEDHAEDAPPPE